MRFCVAGWESVIPLRGSVFGVGRWARECCRLVRLKMYDVSDYLEEGEDLMSKNQAPEPGLFMVYHIVHVVHPGLAFSVEDAFPNVRVQVVRWSHSGTGRYSMQVPSVCVPLSCSARLSGWQQRLPRIHNCCHFRVGTSSLNTTIHYLSSDAGDNFVLVEWNCVHRHHWMRSR